MTQEDRKIICKIVTGSHLYGTNRPDSDLDYTGVFLPSKKDLLGLQNPPTEFSKNKKQSSGERNSAGDVDEKYFNIKQFLKLAAEGQPGVLEMLFAPKECVIESTWEWEMILRNRHLLFSQKGIQPFIGFALAQAHKATIKGDNLRFLRAIEAWGKTLFNHEKNDPIRGFLTRDVTGKYYFSHPTLNQTDFLMDLKPNDHGFMTLTIAGRQYDPGAKVSVLLNSVETLIQRYGSRASAAAEKGYDFKSLMHTYRLLDEAEEFLLAGWISLPRPAHQVQQLLKIRDGVEENDWFDDIMERIEDLRDRVLPLSTLPKEVKWDKINRLCESILAKHLTEKKTFLQKIRDLV